MTSSEPTLLFVYGTLRQGADQPIGAFLASHARRLGPAKCPGRLYDLGPYPALTEPQGEGEWVHGEVYDLARPEVVWPVLDGYEGCGPDNDSSGLYQRRLVRLTIPSGQTLPSWAYFYCRPVGEEKRIWSGDYLQGRPGA